jgi:hypothetical protein
MFDIAEIEGTEADVPLKDDIRIVPDEGTPAAMEYHKEKDLNVLPYSDRIVLKLNAPEDGIGIYFKYTYLLCIYSVFTLYLLCIKD